MKLNGPFLTNNNKEVMVQIGKQLFKLYHWETIKDASQMKSILEKYDVKLLNEVD